mmetsp:Transcript_19196/g.34762  ORF Transcript_19196/g.34762 Transcript_19196/m.34762 type:complete len:226 (+) Transcript_19196:180-857(+)
MRPLTAKPPKQHAHAPRAITPGCHAVVVAISWHFFFTLPSATARRVVGGVSEGVHADHRTIALDGTTSEAMVSVEDDELDLMSALEDEIGAAPSQRNSSRLGGSFAPSSHVQTTEANSSSKMSKRSFSGLCEPESGAHGGALFGCNAGCQCRFWRQCYPRFVGSEQARSDLPSENVGVCEVAVWVLILASLLLFAGVVGSVGMARTYLQSLNSEEMDSLPPVLQK